MVNYIPDVGDVLWISLDPTKGRGQAGRRPALVLTPKSYHEAAGLLVACPITSKVKGYPYELKLPETCKTQGVVLCDQVKSISFRERHAEWIETVPHETLDAVVDRIRDLIGR